jgi:hypothetical protein
MNRPLLLGSIYILRGLSFIVLIWASRDISLLFLFAVLFGLFDYSTVPVTASLVASHMGLRVMGLTMGLLSAGHALGAATGVFGGGSGPFQIFVGAGFGGSKFTVFRGAPPGATLLKVTGTSGYANVGVGYSWKRVFVEASYVWNFDDQAGYGFVPVVVGVTV